MFKFDGFGLIQNTDAPIYLLLIMYFLNAGAFFIMYYSLCKFVFFKKMLSGKKGFLYYFISFVCCAALNMCIEQTGLLPLLITVYISPYLGKEKFKLHYLLELIPLVGVTDGFIYPFEYIPDLYFANLYPYSIIYHLIGVYAFVICIYGIFILFFKKTIRHFEEESKGRTLSKKELLLLNVIGIIVFAYTTLIGIGDNPETVVTIESLTETINEYSVIFGVASYTLVLVGVIVIMIANKRSYYHTRVLDMQSNIISMMAEIIENRDENTGGHIQRTAKYVEIIATELQQEGLYTKLLTNKYIQDMKVAAPLHDIGKIHVSDIILNKPGRLEPEEFEVMKTHAAEGRKLLERAKERLGDFNYLDIAMDMAGSHHEWFDGNPRGYPDHKKGSEIPLCARIMAVADVFDAITSKRCYRDAMDLEKAYSIIKEERGTHFDEAVVDAFFAAKEKIEEALSGFMSE